MAAVGEPEATAVPERLLDRIRRHLTPELAVFISLVSLVVTGVVTVPIAWRQAKAEVRTELIAAERAVRKGDFNDARSALSIAQTRSKDGPLVRVVEAHLRIAEERYEEAVPILREVIFKRESLSIAHFRLAEALVHLGDYPTARSEFERALGMNDAWVPETFRVRKTDGLAALGRAYLSSDDLSPKERVENALRYCQEALGADRQNPEALTCYGDVLARKVVPDYQEAIRAYREACRLQSDNAVCFHQLAVLLHTIGDYESAEVHVEHSLRLRRTDAAERLLLSIVQSGPDQDRYQQLRGRYKRGASLVPAVEVGS